MKPARTPSGASFSWRLDGGVGEATLPPLGGSSLLLTIAARYRACSVPSYLRCNLLHRPPSFSNAAALRAAAESTSPHNEAGSPLRCSAPGRALPCEEDVTAATIII